ncbi:MAG: serine/threonine protein kinase [Proteobacteria bacterium]|nr:serine/threonine protein kinase [Pseudomonadota bacterium]
MTDSPAQHHRRVLEVFDAVVDLADDAREQCLRELCRDDAPLLAEVRAMLAADGSASEPFVGDAAAWGQALNAERDSALDNAMPGRQLGAWRIVGVIGYGGMGTVYAVERDDGAYAQRAALKLIRASADTPIARDRFLRERQILAQLQHPNIATLLDGGINAEGEPWFVMERVDGMPIDQWCDARALGLRDRITLFLQVLDAVRYAHRNLVVHRDLKPSNLLVDGEGRMKLLDFGIAKQLEGTDVTIALDRALTFEYASPEQLHDAPTTTATDIWQLGIVLHRLLSASHPFGLSRNTPVARQLQQLENEPEPLTRSAAHASAEQAAQRGGMTPASLSRVLRGGLSDIVHGCLQRDPEARYASADALANDLHAWLDARPIAAVQPSRRERMRLWLRRNRGLAASIVAIALTLLAGAGVALWQAHKARAQARIAEQQRIQAQAQTKKASQALSILQDAMFAVAPQGQLSAQFSLNDLLVRSRKSLDENHTLDPDVRKAMQRTLANLYGEGQDWAHAEALYRAGLDHVAPPYDHDSAVELAAHFGNYAQVLGVMGKPGEAIAAAEHATALRKRYLPDDVFEQAVSLRNLADAYMGNGDYANAQKNYEQAIAQFRKVGIPTSDQVKAIDALVAFIGLGRCLNAQENYQRALQAVEDALAFADKHGIPVEWDGRAVLLSVKGTAQRNLGDASGALASFRQGVDILGRILGADNPALANGYIGIGGSLNDLGRAHEAMDAYAYAEKIISGKKVQPGTDAKIYAGEAIAWGKLGDMGKRAEYYRRALAALGKADSTPLLALKRKIAAEAAVVPASGNSSPPH